MQLIAALPVEIVQRIVDHLGRQDLVQCQCVCRSWYKQWIQFSYGTVHIRGKVQFQAFFYDTLQTTLMAAPYKTGYHIRKLVIENGHIEPSVLGQLPSLCPYLEVFMFDGVILSQVARRESFQHYQQRRNQQELDKVRHNFALWKQMRELVELNGITVAHALLQQPAPQLTSLSVQFNNQNDRTNSKSSFIQSLHHAPHLQSLGIERIYLTVEELEVIHSSCPELVSLHLSDTVLLPMSAAAAVVAVQPAEQMRRFQFVNGSFCDDVPRWLNYISKKYVHARRLEVGSCSFFAGAHQAQESARHHPQLDDNTTYEPQLLQLARRCNKLRTFKMQSFGLPASFFQLLDQQATCLDELTLGDGLSSNLALELKGLLQSQQRHCIKTLTVLAWPLATEIRGLHTLVSFLGQCAHMTTLHLSLARHFYQNDTTSVTTTAAMDNATMYLDFLLAQCPQLTHLTIANGKVACANTMLLALPTSTTATHGYALTSLALENVLIDIGSDVFGSLMAVHCPRLVDLFLTSTIASPVYHTTRNFNIYLPRHRLRTLVLDRIRVSRKCSVRLGTSRFKMTQDQGVMWYDLVSYECCARRSFASTYVAGDVLSMDRMRARKVKKIQDADVCYSSLDQSVHVSVVCKSIESLYLTGLYIA
ncbi:unnamed protein product [Mucor fragilis]